jgi:hypothetical protein
MESLFRSSDPRGCWVECEGCEIGETERSLVGYFIDSICYLSICLTALLLEDGKSPTGATIA